MRSSLIVATIIVTTGGIAGAHIKLIDPPPRVNDLKTAPCGSGTSVRGTNVTTFAPGETITVTWDETVDHPGHYRISFDNDGNDFQNPSTPDDNFPETLVEPIADKAGGRYTQDVTLPTTPCENCTLQLVQVMTTQVPYNSFYYQCSDIRIADDGGSGVDPGGDGTSGGCNAGGAGSGAGMLLFGALGLVGLRRRRRS